jgi:hypothetical protein
MTMRRGYDQPNTAHVRCRLKASHASTCPNPRNQRPSSLPEWRPTRAHKPPIASTASLVTDQRWHVPPIARSASPSTGIKSP